jgi:hypothetical protein
MIYSLIVSNSVVLVNVVYHLLLCPKNVPLLTIFGSSISSTFKSFLNADADLGFVLDLLSELNEILRRSLKELLI